MSINERSSTISNKSINEKSNTKIVFTIDALKRLRPPISHTQQLQQQQQHQQRYKYKSEKRTNTTSASVNDTKKADKPKIIVDIGGGLILESEDDNNDTEKQGPK